MICMPNYPRSRNSIWRIAHGASAVAFLLTLGAASGTNAQSAVQGVPNAMQGFSQNRDEPIQIEAASLVMVDKKKEATFTGDVKVVQGDTTMKSKILVVFYDSAGSAAPAGSTPPARPGGAADSTAPPPAAAKAPI